MPWMQFWPQSVVGSFGFTPTELQKVLGNTEVDAAYTAAVGVNSGFGGTFTFDCSAIPDGSIIRQHFAVVQANCNFSGYRAGYQYDASSDLIGNYTGNLVWQQNLGTTSVELGAYGLNPPPNPTQFLQALKSTNQRHTFTFISTNAAASVTTYWRKFYLSILYDLPPSKPGLFFGTNF